MDKLTIVRQYIEEYVNATNILTIAVENYSGRDYDTGYHEIVENFEKIRVALQTESFGSVSDFIKTETAKQVEMYQNFLTGLLDMVLKRFEVNDNKKIADYMNRVTSISGLIKIESLKEIRKIEEELNGGSK